MTSEVTSDPASDNDEIFFYRHSRKQEWGLALILWERDGKRAYKFEDGKERIIAEPYYKLLDKTDEEPDSDSVLISEIAKLRGTESDSPSDAMDLEEQLAVFVAQYPGAFGSDKWIKDYRGKEGKRRLKRHRVPAILQAQEILAKPEIERIVETHAHAELQERLVEVLGSTDLVTKAQLEPFRRGVAGEPFTRAFHNALWGEGDLDSRFTELCQQLSMLWARPPWPIATAALALVHPKDHICVKPSVFTKQANCTALPIRPTKLPTSRVYRGYLEMCRQLRSALSDVGAPPHDLIDVYDFIWITQRPAAAEHLARVRAEGVLERSAKAKEAKTKQEAAQAAHDAEVAAAAGNKPSDPNAPPPEEAAAPANAEAEAEDAKAPAAAEAE